MEKYQWLYFSEYGEDAWVGVKIGSKILISAHSDPKVSDFITDFSNPNFEFFKKFRIGIKIIYKSPVNSEFILILFRFFFEYI